MPRDSACYVFLHLDARFRSCLLSEAVAPGYNAGSLSIRNKLVAWHSGRTSVVSRRTFPVLCSTCIWQVTSFGVNRPLQVSQLGQLSLLSFRGR